MLIRNGTRYGCSMFTTDQLSDLIGEPASKIRTWVARGIVMPERPARWSLAEALAVGLFADLMAQNRSTEEASVEAVGMCAALANVIRLALSDRPPPMDCLTFVTAEFPMASAGIGSCF